MGQFDFGWDEVIARLPDSSPNRLQPPMATPSTSSKSTSSTASAPATNPTTVLAQQANQIQQQTLQIQELIRVVTELQQRPSKTTATRGIKLEKYNSGKEGLQPFLTHIKLYNRLNSSIFPTDPNRILAASIYITGRAAK